MSMEDPMEMELAIAVGGGSLGLSVYDLADANPENRVPDGQRRMGLASTALFRPTLWPGGTKSPRSVQR